MYRQRRLTLRRHWQISRQSNPHIYNRDIDKGGTAPSFALDGEWIREINSLGFMEEELEIRASQVINRPFTKSHRNGES
jgi:hypothetical protein